VRLILRGRGVRRRPRGTGILAHCPAPGELKLGDFGRRLRSPRAAAGLTQGALAGRCGLCLVTVSHLENARVRPKSQTLRKLAAALGVGPGELGVRR
jgi:ribosome-binding protein aMBF1 (putative translation factor)